MPDEVLNAGDIASQGGFTEPLQSDVDRWDPDTRKYIESLRRESAGYREKAKAAAQYEEYFGSYDDQDRQVWFGLAQEMQRDPKAAAEYMKQISDGIMNSYQEQVPAAQQNPSNPNYITMEQFKSWQEQTALEAEVAGIEREAGAMGYNPNNAEYIELLWTAQHQTNGDLNAAHEALEGNKQRIIDEYLASKSQDAGRMPQAPGGQGAAPGGQRELKTWADAQRALEARIAAAEGSR